MESSSNISSLTDLELLDHLKRERNNEVVGILFKRHTHLVMGVCMKYLKDEDEAKDCVMEIFEKLLTDLHKYEIQNFRGYLHTVAKNQCLMKFRSRKNKFRREVEDGIHDLEVVEMNLLLHPDDSHDKEAMFKLLEKGIQQLNEHQKKCVELFYLDQKSYQEITDLTGYTMLNVKTHIQNGKRNLKIFMEKNHGR